MDRGSTQTEEPHVRVEEIERLMTLCRTVGIKNYMIYAWLKQQYKIYRDVKEHGINWYPEGF